MPTMPSDYYNRFDPNKNYEKLLYRDGYTLQGCELNEVQSASAYRLRGIADALFKDGDVVRDAQVIVNPQSGEVQAASGVIYLGGAMRGVPPRTFVIPVKGTVAIGVRLTETVISELEDPTLYNPAIGSRGEGEPGAWRLRVDPSWGFDGDGGDGEFYPVYTVDDGELRAKEAPPALDSFTQSLARYDRDSTAGGSYIVRGLTVQQAADDDNGQVYTVAEGRARVNGYGVDLPTSRRISYPTSPDLRLIDTEVHTADATSMAAAGQRLPLAHPPLHEVLSVRITTRKTVSIVHGSYSGCLDAIPDTAVVQIVKIQQGDTVYVAGTDYKKTGDAVDWSPLGNEPATGSTYVLIYDYITAAEPKQQDSDGFSVVGAVENSSILITYRQALPRVDRLCLTQEGQFTWIRGVAAERAPYAPIVPTSLLPIASVHQTWRESGGRVVNDGVRVVAFDEFSAINQRIDYVTAEVARQRLESDVTTRENGARVGLFVDPLLDDDMRDQGLVQTAAVVGGILTLPVTAQVSQLPDDITVPTSLPFAPAELLAQTLRTDDMQVNPYMAFDPLPVKAVLTPAVDYWTDTETAWTSEVTRRLTQGSGNASSTSTNSTVISSTSTKKLEFLRRIPVSFELAGFGEGEILRSVTFDGIDVTPTGLVGDAKGLVRGAFTIPGKVPAGAKAVEFRGSVSRANATFTGQGLLTTTTHQRITTITTTFWQQSFSVDPVAQTFVLERDAHMAGVDVWITKKGTSNVKVQIRQTQTGLPTQVILAEATLTPAQLVTANGGTTGAHTRFQFVCPVALTAGEEYAFVVLCDDAETRVATATLGRFDALRQQWVTSQPYTVGTLLSSGNARTWTAHQDKDLAFRLLSAAYTANERTVELGAVDVSNATDLLLLSLAELTSADTRVEYELALPTGVTLTVAEGQPVRLASGLTGKVAVRAKLTGNAVVSPFLWPGTQLIHGTVAASADYATRSIPARGAVRAVLIYDAKTPSGATVKPELQQDSGAWADMTQTAAVPQGDGLVEFRFETALSQTELVKARVTLAGTSLARPEVSNIRFMAVK